MSNNNLIEPRSKRTSIASDPYAGQYPPPPPLPVQDLAIEGNYQQQQHQQQQQRQQQTQEPEQNHEPFYIIDQSSSRPQNSSFTSSQNRPSFHDDNISAAPTATSSYHSMPEPARGHYYENTNNSHHNINEDGEYYDPESIDLREYLRAEREEKLRQQQEIDQRLQDLKLQQQHPYTSGSSSTALVDMEDAYRHQHPPPRPEPALYNNQPIFNEEQALYNNNSIASPMMMPPPHVFKPAQSIFTPPPPPPLSQPHFLSPFRPPVLGQQASNPSMMHPIPMMPPPPSQYMIGDKFSNKRGDGCCCFGISFCSCLWTIALLIFVGAGVALIVASKIIQDKCTASEEYRETNVALCGNVLHDGLLYGGIAIAGLSAIIVIWRLVRWTCR
jgi:hypothetical protein